MHDEGPVSAPARGLTTLLQELAAASPGEAERAWPSKLPAGERVGRFEILREIGRGGFGVVYEALDTELGRKVALKMLRPARSGRQLAEEWLRREADACARLNHPGLVTLHDAGLSPHGPWLAMELLRGETLADRIARGPLPPADALGVAIEIAQALGHAHARGVLHRDLKPGNVFLTEDGTVKLLDLGLAHVLGTRAETAGGGTPGYMSPEQSRGDDTDPRSDVFSAGLILHELLGGARRLRVAQDAAGDVHAPPPLPPRVPASLRRLVARCASVERDARPANGNVLASELRDTKAALARPAARRRALGIATAAVAVGITVGIAFAPWASLRSRPALVAIAVADVVNETRDPELDGLSEMLVAALEPSKTVQVLTRSRLADAVRNLGRAVPERIDETLAVEVASSVGMKALLLPSVRRFDDLYAVHVRGIDPSRDTYLFALKDEGLGKQSVPAAIERLAARARELLGDDAARTDAKAPEPAGSAVSLAAYRHYFDALRYADQGLFEQEQAQLREALRIDPSFARAHLRLAVSEYGFPPLTEAERAAHLAAARQGAGALPEADRLLLEAETAIVAQRLDDAATLLDEAAARRPDKRVLYKLAQLRSTRDLTLGRPEFRKALALDPSWVPAQNDLLISYCWNGEHAEATRLAAEWAQRWPSAQTYGVLNGAQLWAGDLEGALEAARGAEKLGPGVIAHVGRTLMARGDLAGAEAEFRRLWDRGERLLYDFTLADALFLRGKRREAGRVLDELERSSPEAALVARRTRAFNAAESTDLAEVSAAVRAAEPELIPIERVVLALRLAAAGHVEMAERLADVRGAYGMEAHLIEAGRAIVAAARAREQRDLVHARRILEDARARAPFASHRTLDHFIGEVCHLANDDRCAVAALSNARAWWGFMAGSATYHRNRYLLALSLDRLERKAEARTEAEDLLRMLADADADLPVRLQAQELCRRLACRS